jgi:hypothetical protein
MHNKLIIYEKTGGKAMAKNFALFNLHFVIFINASSKMLFW